MVALRYDIQSYGTIGTSNDTATFQAAHDAVAALGGGVIVCPTEDYTIGQVDWDGDNITFMFAPGSTIACVASAQTSLFEISGDGARLRCEGTVTVNGGGNATYFLRLLSNSACSVKGRFVVTGTDEHAFVTFLAHDWGLEDCRFTNNDMLLTNGGNTIRIKNLKGTFSSGTFGTRVVFDINGNQSGNPGSDILIEGVTIEDTGATTSVTCFAIQPTTATSGSATNVTVNDCHVTGWGHDSFNFINCNGLRVSGCSSTDSYSMFFLVQNAVVSDCRVIRAQGAGFTIGDPVVMSPTSVINLVNCQAIGCGVAGSTPEVRDRVGFLIVGNNGSSPSPLTVQNVILTTCQAMDDGTDNQEYGLSVYQYVNGVECIGCKFSGNAVADTYVGNTSVKNVHVNERGIAWVNAKDYGAVGDSVFTQDGAITSGARVLTCTSSDPFLSSDAAIVVTAAGSGGTNGTFNLIFSGGGGSSAAGQFTVAGGVITVVWITNRGTGYTSAPTVSFSNSTGLTGAAATVNVSGGSLWGLYVEVPGADTGGNVLATRISTFFINTDTVHLDATAGTTVTSATVCVHRTNEDAAFAAAVDAATRLSLLSGQQAGIYFPAGCYTGQLAFSSKTDWTIRGDGPATTLSYVGSLSGINVINIPGSQRVDIQDLRVFGGNTGIRTDADTRGTWRNLLIEGQKQGSEFAANGAVTRSGTTATMNTVAAHGLSNGNIVSIYGSTIYQYNGTVSVTVTDSDTFTYTIPNDPGASSSGTVLGTLAGDGDAIYINGDGSMELKLENIYGSDFEGFGVDVTRTTTTDVGGLFMHFVFMGMKSGTSGIGGLRCVSTQNAGTKIFLRLSQCVFDNFSSGASTMCVRVRDLTFTDVWTSSNIATTGSAVFADCEEVNISQCKLDNQSTTGYALQIDSGKANGSIQFDINHNRLTGNTSGSTAIRLTTSATAGTFAQINTLGNNLLGAPIFSNVLLGQGDGGMSAMLPSIFLAANLTTVTVHVSQTSYFVYLGKAPPNLASVQIRYRVTTAYTGGTTWGEVGIYKGASIVNAGAGSLTRLGTANFTNSVALGTTTVTVSNVNAGDDLWLCIASSGNTPAQYRAGLADDLQTGLYQSIASTRPSTAAATLTTAAAGATLAVPWLAGRMVLP